MLNAVPAAALTAATLITLGQAAWPETLPFVEVVKVPRSVLTCMKRGAALVSLTMINRMPAEIGCCDCAMISTGSCVPFCVVLEKATMLVPSALST